MPKNYRTLVKCLVMLLIAFGLLQIPFAIPSSYYSIWGITPDVVISGVQILIIVVFVIAIKLDDSNFGDHGLKWFEDSKKQIAISVFLAIVYVFINLYIQGYMVGLIPGIVPISLEQLPIEVAKALIAGISIELAFRGYTQREFTKAYGFLPALYLGSLLFSFEALVLSPTARERDPLAILVDMASLFVLGIFLGLFFDRTKSLVGPVTFQIAYNLANSIIPTKPFAAPIVTLVFDIIASICVLILMIMSVSSQRET